MSQPILVVDDEPINLRVLGGIIGTLGGVSVLSAMNGEEALALAAGTTPDVVLLDVMMPGMDGYTLCQTLRAMPRFSRTRIIMVSSKATTEERLKGYQAGADDYVTKPFVPDELLAKVRVYANLAKAEGALLQLNVDLEEKVRLRTDQLVSTQRAAFLGAHAAEIVHNLNNPLAIVLGNVRILAEEFEGNARLAKVSRALEKMCDIIKTILQANKIDEEVRDLNLNEILANEIYLQEVSSYSDSGVKMIKDLGEIPTIKGQAIHFAQSFANLIKNSLDAMHGSPKKELQASTRQANGSIEIRISDTGGGIPEENLKRIFDPFFTTKPFEAANGEPVGNGLGLASVLRMLKAIGANIEFTSALGVGTTALIRVPLEGKPKTTAAATKEVRDVSSSKPAPMPVDEAARQRAVQSLGLTGQPHDQFFNDLVLLGASLCQAPMATISVIDGDRQRYTASVGTGGVTSGSRDSSFCAHTILSKEPLVVEDTLLDDRFASNPVVTGGPKIRFYAGVPLVFDSPDAPAELRALGSSVGTLCIMDDAPRQVTSHHLEGLKALSRLLVTQIVARLRNPG